jgi:hypothetical protein
MVGVAGSNPDQGMDFRLLCLLCVIYAVAFAASMSLVQRNVNFLNVCDLENSTKSHPGPEFVSYVTEKKEVLV